MQSAAKSAEMSITTDELILVNERDEQVGTMEKMEAHRKGIFHRAFSVFIFNHNGEMLLQQRAAGKYHSANLWTNACCSHPRPGETALAGAQRRLKEELGFEVKLQKAFEFTYHASFDNGLTEHEYDHVFVGEYEGEILPNPEEVQAYAFKQMDAIQKELRETPGKYTAWFAIAFPMIEEWAREKDKAERGEDKVEKRQR